MLVCGAKHASFTVSLIVAVMFGAEWEKKENREDRLKGYKLTPTAADQRQKWTGTETYQCLRCADRIILTQLNIFCLLSGLRTVMCSQTPMQDFYCLSHTEDNDINLVVS